MEVPAPVPQEAQVRQMAMLLHLSQFLGFVVPFAGLAAPIIIWQVKKTEMPEIDAHGKMITNWIISALIYGAFSFVLIFLLIGIPMLMVLGLLALIFPIIGAIRANDGELWRYPLTINFIK